MNKSQFQEAADISAELATCWFPYIDAALKEFGIDSPASQAMFIAQAGEESQSFNRLTENLNYSPEGLRNTFGKYFTPERAQSYGRTKIHPADQKGIANIIYANRLGNTGPDDGWKYRGRGLIQITGRDNYHACGVALHLDLLLVPQLLEQEEYAARSAAWFWHAHDCDEIAGDIEAVTRIINGGLNGLEERLQRFERAKTAFRL